jgi:hypothetical protein
MKIARLVIAPLLSLLVLLNALVPAVACGPEYIQPIFVSSESPDPPFSEFTTGKIGIVKPDFGKKTLIIAYRYLNGGSFTAADQTELIAALNGAPPEDDQDTAIKNWVEARKELLEKDEKLPAIYAERRYGGYDFFPNCAPDAFKVATETMKDRVSRYGADDNYVRDWLTAQDTVFENCSGGAKMPEQRAEGYPVWLRKDRDYQIAAAYFYSLNFERARQKFQTIASDTESPWQETADYLIARTLVREASLADDPAKRKEIYEQAELKLLSLLGRNSRFSGAEQRLSGLIKYRAHPEERVQELARTLGQSSWDDNLKQNLIDYVWLIDKFEAQTIQAERKKEEAQKPPPPPPYAVDPAYEQRRKAIDKGELISIYLYQKNAEGQFDYRNVTTLDFNWGVSEADVQAAFEAKLGRKVNGDELTSIRERYESEVEHHSWLMSPNRKLGGNRFEYESCFGECNEITLDKFPKFLHTEDLTDWLLTVQSKDAAAYNHALKQWRATEAPAWLVATLIKSDPSSRQLARVIQAAEKIAPEHPASASVVYHLIRLKIATGKTNEARKLLDSISSQAESLPVSAQNQFKKERLELSSNLSEFLKSAQEKPVAFYYYGRYASMSDIFRIVKSTSHAEELNAPPDQYEHDVEERFKDLLPWDERTSFDDATVDVLNWHFSTERLLQAALDPALPDYLRDRLALAVWTRSILLNNEKAANRIAPEIPKLVPQTASTFSSYFEAHTKEDKDHAALFVLLKFQGFSPFVASGIPEYLQSNDYYYYLESAWWCPLTTTEYVGENQVAKVVRAPSFLLPHDLEIAKHELAQLQKAGDAKSYLARRVLEWAKAAPKDERIPEALYIAAKATATYKYGCSGWDHDEEAEQAATKLLTENYSSSPWATKLEAELQKK